MVGTKLNFMHIRHKAMMAPTWSFHHAGDLGVWQEKQPAPKARAATGGGCCHWLKPQQVQNEMYRLQIPFVKVAEGSLGLLSVCLFYWCLIKVRNPSSMAKMIWFCVATAMVTNRWCLVLHWFECFVWCSNWCLDQLKAATAGQGTYDFHGIKGPLLA